MLVKGVAEGWGGTDDREASAALVEGYERGILHWDTADAYGAGHAEEIVGRVWSQVPRDAIFLASKVGHAPLTDVHPYEPVHLRKQVEASLRRLQTDYLDACYLHHCDFGPADQWLPEAVSTMKELVGEGLVRHFGLSDWDIAKVAHYAEIANPDLVQVPRNVAQDDYLGSPLASWVADNDAGAVFFSPLKHGLLLGLQSKAVDYTHGDIRGRLRSFADEGTLRRIADAARTVEAGFTGRPQPLLQALIAPLLDASRHSVLIGLRRPRHVRAAALVEGPVPSDLAAWVRSQFVGLPPKDFS